MQRRSIQNAGFTVLELVVTIVVLGSLLLVANFTIHETDYSAQQADAKRSLAVGQLAQWLIDYRTEHGEFPPGMTDKPLALGSETGQLNWCQYFVPSRAKDLPYDPVVGMLFTEGTCADAESIYATDYTVMFKNNVLTVDAPAAEVIKPIRATHRY